ncbi:hypothetical protein ACJIZ3_010243 [Penstemon smallii]|uniref:Serine-rich protein n=1 Tax=Penstemon smallii TaxID=265156 RepID=A0ABD3TGR0_9LAMI
MASRNSSSSSGRACLCSPTSHPGSFRCSLHRSSRNPSPKPKPSVNRIMENPKSMVSKLGLLKAFLMHMIKPSSNDLHRRRNFKPKPTRFCKLNNNNNDKNGDHHNRVAVS